MNKTARFVQAISALAALVVGTPAFAVQMAIVAVERAEIRARPMLDSPLLDSLPAGTRIKISSGSKDGWYKVRARSGSYGWIWQADITIATLNRDMSHAGMTLGDQRGRKERHTGPLIHLRGGGGLFALIATEVNNKIGIDSLRPFFSPNYVGEFQLRLTDSLRLGCRAMWYDFVQGVSVINKDYDLQFTGTPLLLGLEATAGSTELFDFNLGLYAGLGLHTTFTVNNKTDGSPNSASFSANSYAAMLTFGTKHWITRSFAATLELGAYYTRIAAAKVERSFNGDELFREAGPGSAFSTFNVDHVGPMASVLVEIAL